MRASLSPLLLGCALSAACVHEYAPPKLGEPHAVVKIERIYSSHAGRTLTEVVWIDDDLIHEQSTDVKLDEPRSVSTTALVVHPEITRWQLRSSFTHIETDDLDKNTTVRARADVPIVAYRDAIVHPASTDETPQWHMDDKPNVVVDATCTRYFEHRPLAGHMYLFSFKYTGPDSCSLECFEQLPRDNAPGFDTKRCESVR